MYSVEKIPLYDSAEDEPSSKLLKTESAKSGIVKSEYLVMNGSVKSEYQLGSTSLAVPMEGVVTNGVKIEEIEEVKLYSQDTQQNNALISRIRSNSASRNYRIGPRRRAQHHPNGKLKHLAQKQIDVKHVAQLLASKEAQAELLIYEELRDEATSQLSCLYNEIRPAIEEHERDNQDNVATSVAEKWIEVSCIKLKKDFNLYSSIIKNLVCTPRNQATSGPGPAGGGGEYLEFPHTT